MEKTLVLISQYILLHFAVEKFHLILPGMYKKQFSIM